jgi:uncharacterized membrane protein (UPF0127 family)
VDEVKTTAWQPTAGRWREGLSRIAAALVMMVGVFAAGGGALSAGAGAARVEAFRTENSPARDSQTGTTHLTITTRSGTFSFTVELARSRAEQARGLMYRKSLADSAGMLFPYDPPRAVAMWMKNTYIPLDILFIDASGRIIRIAPEAAPLSLDIIPSGEPVAAVLELKGGTARRLGLHAGAEVRYKALGR